MMIKLQTMFFWFTITFSLLAANGARDFQKIIQELNQVVRAANQTGRPVRLAIMTFVSTRSSENTIEKNEFGEYLTESIITSLAKRKREFRIFERKRLDLIIKENALGMTGLISQNQALKLGELAPIDYIFSGTYTKLKNYIDINCRLMDVVTGEILTTYKGRIKLNPDLAALFQGAGRKDLEVDPCVQKKKEIEYLLNDLSTPDKIDNLVNQAVKIPFDLKCGRIHFTIMYSFKRYRLENPTYKKFLLKSLLEIDFPANDQRARRILTFFSKESVIDQIEWQAGLKTVRKIGNYTLAGHLRPLLRKPNWGTDLSQTFERVDAYLKLVLDKKVGLPVPVAFNFAFFELVQALDAGFQKENRVLMYCYENYGHQLVQNEKSDSKISGLLKRMYFRENNKSAKDTLLNWISQFFNHRPINEKMADALFDFTQNFEITDYKKERPEELKKIPQEHLQLFIANNRKQICNAVRITQFGSQKEDRINFCLEHDIPCPEEIPTIQECITMIKSENYNAKVRALDILERMGEKAKPAEAVVRNALGITDLSQDNATSTVQGHAATILGNIKTSNPTSINLLVKSLSSLHYRVPDAAQAALVKIGRPAVPFLIKALNSKFGGVQFKAVRILGMLGKKAVSAKKPLQRLLKTTNNSAVHRAAEETLKAIEADLQRQR